MLQQLDLILTGTKFPENVGMAARACANMGVSSLMLAAPSWWDADKARPLATGKGETVLDNVRVVPSLREALAPTVFSVATTARLGGWRREILSPEEAAQELVAHMAEGRVALVMGPEDRGLSNEDIEQCGRIACIPTSGDASSLNVAQASLILLYECARAARKHSGQPRPRLRGDAGSLSRLVTHDEQERVYATLRDILLDIDYIKPDNPDYFLMPLRRFLGKTPLRRHEMDMLMGICRQIRNRIGATGGVHD